jgi:hypothetical protein
MSFLGAGAALRLVISDRRAISRSLSLVLLVKKGGSQLNLS